MKPTFITKPSVPPLFTGFPYLLSYLAAGLYHVILLPENSLYSSSQLEAARHQAQANKLRTWLVLSESEAVFFAPGLSVAVRAIPPRPRAIAFGKLLTKEVIGEQAEILARYQSLRSYADCLHGDRPGYIVGNLTKGGRLASDSEINRLRGRRRNGVPKGLHQCGSCRAWIGLCLDTSNPRLLVRVHCRCHNDNCCARCGQRLYEFKLNSNYFSESDGHIWHVPGFCATGHRCPLAVESWVTGSSITPKTRKRVQ